MASSSFYMKKEFSLYAVATFPRARRSAASVRVLAARPAHPLAFTCFFSVGNHMRSLMIEQLLLEAQRNPCPCPGRTPQQCSQAPDLYFEVLGFAWNLRRELKAASQKFRSEWICCCQSGLGRELLWAGGSGNPRLAVSITSPSSWLSFLEPQT